MSARILLILCALDHLVFALLTLGNCRYYEMISSAAWDMERDGKWLGRLSRPVIDLLFSPFQKDHCEKSWLWQKELYK